MLDERSLEEQIRDNINVNISFNNVIVDPEFDKQLIQHLKNKVKNQVVEITQKAIINRERIMNGVIEAASYGARSTTFMNAVYNFKKDLEDKNKEN